MREQVLMRQLFESEGHALKVALLEKLAPAESVLESLLGSVVSQSGVEPEASRESLLAVAHVADASGLARCAARARYFAAQNYAANGHLNIALNLIEAAREGFSNVGSDPEVMRTHIGRINVLAELGRYAEALTTANEVVGHVNAMAEPSPEFKQLRCLAWLNMGSCHWHMGSHALALDAFAAAEAGFQEVGAANLLPAVANNRGLVLMEMGRIKEALEAFLLTAYAAGKAGTPVPEGQALANAARASGLLGEFENALARFAESRRILEGLAATDEAVILRETADLYLTLNLYEEAREAYEEAVTHLRATGARRHLGWALWGLGAYGIATNKHDLASKTLSEAIEVFTETDNSMSLSGVLLERSSLHLLSGNTEAARADASHALALVSGSDLSTPKAFAHLRLAEALWGQPERAEAHLVEAELLSKRIGLPQLLFRCQLKAGQLRHLQNRFSDAQRSFEEAVTQVEGLRGRIPQEAVRASFMGDKTELYEAWVELLLDMGRITDAFNATEQAKSRTLVDILNGTSGISRMELPSDDRGLELHRELMAVYNRLLSTDPAVNSGSSADALRERARSLEAELQRSAIRASSVVGGCSSVSGPLSQASPATWGEVSAAVATDAILVEYFIAGGDVVAFVGCGGEIEAQRTVCCLNDVRPLIDRLFVQWQRCELNRDREALGGGRLLASCQRVLVALYRLLWEPLKKAVEKHASVPGQPLVIIPHGCLHRLPFHAFCDTEKRYLIEDYELSYAPSATVMALCQKLSSTSIKSATLVGTETDTLPSIAEELSALEDLLPGAQVLRDEAATVEAVRETVGGKDLVHLACHGIFRSDNPLYSALQLSGGWLTAADLLSLDLDGALLTLSACESGRSQVNGGDELIGFSRAALAAGASSVVVSGWRVDDGTTAELMRHFYTKLRQGEGRAESLRAAQLTLMATHPHPWHWAPFSLNGRRT